MKVKILIALAACLGMTAVIGCGKTAGAGKDASQEAQAQGYRIAISDVLNRMLTNQSAAIQVETKFPGIAPIERKETNFLMMKYTQSLRAIDASQCPQKFKLAWLNYVQTCEQNAIHQNTPEDILETAHIVLAASHGSASGFDAASKREEKTDTFTAWQKVEMSALEFGVEHKSRKLVTASTTSPPK